MKNNVAIATGASPGIGRATALRLARDFSCLILTARNKQALDDETDAIPALQKTAKPMAATE